MRKSTQNSGRVIQLLFLMECLKHISQYTQRTRYDISIQEGYSYEPDEDLRQEWDEKVFLEHFIVDVEFLLV